MKVLDESAATQMEALAEATEKAAKAKEAETAKAVAKQQAADVEAAMQKRFGKNSLVLVSETLPVQGFQLLPPKLLGIIEKVWEILETPFIGSLSYTTAAMKSENDILVGNFDRLVRSIMISLHQIFEDTVEETTLENGWAVDAACWIGLLEVTIHEMVHSIIDDEDVCEEKADDILTSIAQKWDIEVPALIDMGWLGVKLDAFYKDIEDRKEDIYVQQRQMRVEQVVFMFPESKKRIDSIRNFCRLHNADRSGEEGWNEATVALMATATQPVAQATVGPIVDVMTTTAPATTEQGMTLPNITEEPAIASELPAGAEELLGVYDHYMQDEMTIPTVDPAAGVQLTPNANAAVQQPQATAAPNPWDVPSTLPAAPLTGTPETSKAAVEAMMKLAFQQIFCNCGWDYKGNFTNANAVMLNEIDVSAIPSAPEILVGLDTVINGRKEYNVTAAGVMRGFVASKTKLPMFNLHLNNGVNVRRFSMMPQNPVGKKLSENAQRGEMIMWVTCENEFMYKLTCPTGQPVDANNIEIEHLN